MNVYPPRFKISVNRLSRGQKLDTEFKVVLENDGVLAADEVRKFPLIITKLVTEALSGKVVSMLYSTYAACKCMYSNRTVTIIYYHIPHYYIDKNKHCKLSH